MQWLWFTGHWFIGSTVLLLADIGLGHSCKLVPVAT